MSYKLKLRNDTKANWESVNPVLLDGEMAVVDYYGNGVYNMYKIGDGSTSFNSLPYYPYDSTKLYQSRVYKDAGLIDNNQLMEWLMNQNQNLINEALFYWDGVGGTKYASGKASKIYSFNGTNDAVQANSAYQPYVGGTIAPNESLKIKGFSGSVDRYLELTPISFTGSQAFTLSYDVKLNSTVSNPINTIISNNTTATILYMYSNKLDVRFAGVDVTNFYSNSEVGKNINITIVYDGAGHLIVYKNGVLFNSYSVTITSVEFSRLLGTSGLHRTLDGQLPMFGIWNRALSASEIQLQYTVSSQLHPEIEGIDIGNQHWATSNLEVTQDGAGNAFAEVQYSSITAINFIPSESSTFETDGTSYWVAFLATNSYDSGNQCMNVASTNDVYSQVYTNNNNFPNNSANKLYRFKFDVKSNDFTGILNIGYNRILIKTISNPAITSTYQTVEFIGTIGVLFSGWTSGTTLSIDNISIREVGWDESQEVYTAVYDSTSGTAQAKDLAASKAAAMWRHPNNSSDDGAIMGKEYNGFATKLLYVNPIAGWRVPSYEDQTQLVNYLGGSTVAGAKLKAIYGLFIGANETNESGFSAIPTGYVNISGIQASLNAFFTANTNGTNVGAMFADASTNGCTIVPSDSKIQGFSIRLLRNEPVGDMNIQKYGVSIADNASSALKIAIPFGYSVETVRFKSINALTNITAEVRTTGGTLLSTLFTGKSIDANTTKVLLATGDQTELKQDAEVWIYSTGNAGGQSDVYVNLDKTTLG